MAKSSPAIELETDDQFQRNEWRLQRLGWLVWTSVLIAAGLGLLGPGWLSDVQKVASDNSIEVSYERFLHYHNPSQLDVQVRSASAGGPWQLHVDRSLLDRLEIASIEPQPQSSATTPTGIMYSFERQGNEGRIIFHVEYERYGPASGEITLAGHSPINVSQFVYP